MKGLFIRGIDAELRQSLIDCGFKPVKQDVYFNGTMVTSDGKLWHPSEPFKPWNPDGKGWPECKVFNNANDFLTTITKDNYLLELYEQQEIKHLDW